MPQASVELQNWAISKFGDISDTNVITYLEGQGYKLTPKFLWVPKEGVSTYDDMTEEEYLALNFLVQEWDYGGLTTMNGL